MKPSEANHPTPPPQRPGRPVPSGPNSVPTTLIHDPPAFHTLPHAKTRDPRAVLASEHIDSAELVSVPPSSSATNTRTHPDGAGITVRARAWTDHRDIPRHGRPALLRKEVIQPHLPVRLPCYDFVPIADPAFDGSLPQGVGPPASGVTDFRDVTGGVYKARERIHRSVADLRLLATPTSWGRVADPNPN